MPESKNIVLLTSTQRRHRYFVERLHSQFPIAAVFTESFSYPEPQAATAEEARAWDWYFTRRAEYEKRVFGPGPSLPAANPPAEISIPKGKLNAPETLDAVARHRPGFLALFGTGLLSREFIGRFPDRLFNLHAGLPTHCRGSGCNFWPVHDGHPEQLGAAIHRVDAGIDSGTVILEDTPVLEAEEDEQTLSGKPVMLGVELMAAVLRKWLAGEKLPAQEPKPPGRLRRMKEFTPAAVLRVKRMVESGELHERVDAVRRSRRQ